MGVADTGDQLLSLTCGRHYQQVSAYRPKALMQHLAQNKRAAASRCRFVAVERNRHYCRLCASLRRFFGFDKDNE